MSSDVITHPLTSVTLTTPTSRPFTAPTPSTFTIFATSANGVPYTSTVTVTLYPTSSSTSSSGFSSSYWSGFGPWPFGPSSTTYTAGTAAATSGPAAEIGPSQSGTNKGAIAGGILGGLAALLLALLAVWLCLLRRRRRGVGNWQWRRVAGPAWRELGDERAHVRDREVGDMKYPPPPAYTPSDPLSSVSVSDGKSGSGYRESKHAEDGVGVHSPPPALYIREHRQPVQDPFGEGGAVPPVSPRSPTSMTAQAQGHRRGTSSFGSGSGPLLPEGYLNAQV